MTGSWNDFNDADSQTSYDLIPKGTIVPVRMTIKPGGYDDPSQGWVGGYATRNDTSGSVYLNAEFVLLIDTARPAEGSAEAIMAAILAAEERALRDHPELQGQGVS